MSNSLFIVIEGLDGSGKTTASRRLTQILKKSMPNGVKNSFEPHDPSAAGLFIRQILMKKIEQFDPRVLAYAFATNRLDHCTRVVNPWLENEKEVARLLICDRFYLSSLVYQTSKDFGLKEVMTLNEKARQPDIIFFMNVSNEVCYARMAKRNQPQELFETKLSETRQKYLQAIDFLRKKGDNIIEIDASGTVESVVEQMLFQIKKAKPEWTIETELSILEETNQNHPNEEDCLKYLSELGYEVGKPLPAMPFESIELEYEMNGGIRQRGMAVITNEYQRFDLILELLNESHFYSISDFVIIFVPVAQEVLNDYFQRENVLFENGKIKISPNVKWVGIDKLV